MAIIYVNAGRLAEMDYTGDEMEQIKDEVSDLYNLNHYKRAITEYAAEIGETESTEDTAAEIAKRFFVDGYMQAVSELTDRYSEIIASATIRR